MVRKQKLVGLLLTATLLVSPVTALATGQNQLPDPETYAKEVPISAQEAAVIDVKSGRILYEKNADKKTLIASTTKVITAIVAIESGKLNDTVTISPNAARQEGSSIYLEPGEKYKLIDLVYGMMLRSGNDAATAIAEYVGGSVEGFAEKMNALVEKLGLKETHFANPHGLDHPEHYSSAHDMAVLTAYALRNPIFQEIVSTKFKTIPWPGKEWDRKMKNKNKMLDRYDGADGVKTGYTKKSGRCLISSATRDGRQIAVVVLNDPNDWNDSAHLLDYGFSKYKFETLAGPSTVVKTLPVSRGEATTVAIVSKSTVQYPIRTDEQNSVTRQIDLPASLAAPVRVGRPVGTMNVFLHNQKLASVELIPQVPVSDIGFWKTLQQLLHVMFTN
ncbi:D-alanyl-D-alanine carboxypeptidase [Fodinisporobacter ferrooxydans]|uniref:serine-type D-Ala-D-Ala carboxypeptidase n=1 Tax=Fodinisporobacter ferrooxydans TaxID=2901836 RepID=A0ABY4CHN7_9BACL|nr:D-alanyl-D-alanine carboxypeptidase [Alicyclobacillaceae bacterium MYW30-H2]